MIIPERTQTIKNGRILDQCFCQIFGGFKKRKNRKLNKRFCLHSFFFVHFSWIKNVESKLEGIFLDLLPCLLSKTCHSNIWMGNKMDTEIWREG